MKSLNKPFIFNGGSLTWTETAGVQRVTAELLKELDKITIPGEVQLAIPEGNVLNMPFSNIQVINVNVPQRLRKSIQLWNQWFFPYLVKKHQGVGIDLLLAFPVWACDAVMLYDCIRERFQSENATFEAIFRRLHYVIRVRRALRHVKLIMTDSYDAQQDIADYYKLDKNKIKVVPCAWQHFESITHDTDILNKLRLKEKEYFFSLGSTSPRKNFEWILKAAKLNSQYKFVISGSRILETNDKELDSQEIPNLIFTGYLKDSEIKTLMRGCRAFIQPSLYEGFGIPPMEAMSCGVQVIVSDIPIMHEIYSNSVHYIDPHNPDVDFDTLLKESVSPAELILNRYSWEKSARKVLELLREM